jgi:integrase
MKRAFTDRTIQMLKPKAKPYYAGDPQLPLHYVKVTSSGHKSFWVVPRDPLGKQRWTKIGDPALMSIDEAREAAKVAIKRIQAGQPLVEPKGETFAAVAANFLKRHVGGNGLRSKPEITRLLTKHVLPVWGEREFVSIGRGDVAALLDQIEDDRGARQADYVLAITRKIANWYATRHDDYVPPFVKGMARRTAKQRERDRILTDDELRRVWKAAEGAKEGVTGKTPVTGTFGDLVRLLLLTAQRREKVVAMRWQDIDADGVWSIPREAREKGAPAELVLPDQARVIIEARSQLGSNPYVLAAARGDGPIRGFSKCKRAFDAACDVEGWTLHDLRRTARSLMSRAGVLPAHAERTLGHVQPGVIGIYDRHQYRDEVRFALRKLAGLIDTIVRDEPNVVSISA